MAETGFCDVDGGRLYYEVEGSGPALALIHAGVANLRQWDEQVPEFSRHHRVIRYDSRTYGKTTTDNVEVSNRGDLAALLDHLGVEWAAILGLSRGGQIAVDFTLAYPDRASALIAVAAGISGFDFPTTPEEQALWDEYERRYDAGDWEWVVDTETAMWVDGPGQPSDRVPAEIRQRVHDWIAEGYKAHANEEPSSKPLDPPAAKRLGEITVPTLVMVGDLDTRDTVAACRKLVGEIPGARLEVFKGVAHMVNLEQPERFTRLVLEFLDGAGLA
jgi:pimeloyl-ACP methyl ester carboxylesterase